MATLTPSRNRLDSNINMGVSPLRRSVITSTPFSEQQLNDDDVERSRRRSIASSNRRLSKIGALTRNSVSGSPTMSDGANCTLNEITSEEHLNICLKLYTENKINTKNAWNLQIIEYMKQALFKGGDTSQQLQIASSTFDIGAKVYGIRVDDIHNEFLKLATAMARINSENRDEDDNDDEAAEENEEEAASKKQQKKEKKRKRLTDATDAVTLAAKEESITGKILPHSTTYNRLVTLCPNRLHVLSSPYSLKSGHALLAPCLAEIPYWTSLENSKEHQEKLKCAELTLEKVLPGCGDICPPFRDFVVDQWEPSDEDSVLDMSRHNVMYDDNGFPIPELDASLNNLNPDHLGDDHFADGLNNSDIEEELMPVGHTAAFGPEVAHVTDMRPTHLMSIDNHLEPSATSLEYSYRSAPMVSNRYTITGLWAGPSHWKVKCLQRSNNNSATTVDGVRGVTRKRLAKTIEYPRMNCLINMKKEDIEDKLNVSKKTFKKKRPTHDISKFTLPEDLDMTVRNLHQLENKMKNLQTPSGDICDTNLNINPYDYNNPKDGDYCSQTLTSIQDGNNSDDLFDGGSNGGDDGVDMVLDGDNMVDRPNFVEQIKVPYATQAKKMDMKKLKDAMWKGLCEATDQYSNEEVATQCTQERSGTFENVLFTDVYNKLHGKLATRFADELSTPLAFVALLHLTNENSLVLKSCEALDNFFINSQK